MLNVNSKLSYDMIVVDYVFIMLIADIIRDVYITTIYHWCLALPLTSILKALDPCTSCARDTSPHVASHVH